MNRDSWAQTLAKTTRNSYTTVAVAQIFNVGDKVFDSSGREAVVRVVYPPDSLQVAPYYEVIFSHDLSRRIVSQHNLIATKPMSEYAEYDSDGSWCGINKSPPPLVKRCECGSDFVGGGLHSTWCPKADV